MNDLTGCGYRYQIPRTAILTLSLVSQGEFHEVYLPQNVPVVKMVVSSLQASVAYPTCGHSSAT